MKPEPLLKDYRVCLVVPQIGLNAAQLLEVAQRIKRVVPLLPEGERVRVLVPTYDPVAPQAGLQPEVRNLERLGVTLALRGLDPRAGGAAKRILDMVEHEYGCDEVWCCPESTNRLARANQVYALGQRTRWAPRYKLVPPWVEPEGVSRPAVKQTKKERPW